MYILEIYPPLNNDVNIYTHTRNTVTVNNKQNYDILYEIASFSN